MEKTCGSYTASLAGLWLSPLGHTGTRMLSNCSINSYQEADRILIKRFDPCFFLKTKIASHQWFCDAIYLGHKRITIIKNFTQLQNISNEVSNITTWVDMGTVHTQVHVCMHNTRANQDSFFFHSGNRGLMKVKQRGWTRRGSNPGTAAKVPRRSN